MKRAVVVFVMLFGLTSGFCQQANRRIDGYRIGAQYNHEFVLDGYVKVREWDLPGDKIKLKDLDVNDYSALKVYVEKDLKRNRSLSLAYDHYFMRGEATINRDIRYNGTIINGRKGVDVSPTRYYRLTLNYCGNLLDMPQFELQYTVGLVFDYVKFYLDGEVTTSSPRAEVYEGFGRQAFPYPFVGLKAMRDFEDDSKINFELSGTYIPEFRSFYTEGGHVRLQYSNFQADLNYSKSVSNFDIMGGARFRHMHLFQESREDTNILNTLTIGPYVGVVYNF